MAQYTTGNVSQIVADSMPPTLGTTNLRPFVDEIFGIPFTNQNYDLTGLNDQTKYVQSLPELLFGLNKTNLGTKVVQSRLMEASFLTQIFAPITEIGWNDSLEITWDTITFDPHLPQVTPEEGRTRIGSWSYSSQSDGINRMGLGAEFHHEFLYTNKGQMIARGVMDQINNGIQTHLEMGVMQAIIHAPDYAYNKEKERLQTTWKSQQVSNFFERTKRYWGILQREEKAVYQIENWIKAEQKTYGGQSDSVCLHWKLAFYVALANPRNEYYRTGDRAQILIEKGIEALGTFGSSHLAYMIDSFDVDRDHGPIDLLKRRVVYGEFYLMFDHIPNHYQSYEGYQTSWRSIQLIDADSNGDQRSTITMLEGAKATNMWDDDGEIISPDDTLLREYSVDGLKGKERRHSFWWKDPSGNMRACRLFGQIAKPYFSPASVRRLAYTAVQGSPLLKSMYTSHEVTRAIDTLQSAIRYMGNVTDGRDLMDWYSLVIQVNSDAGEGEKHDGQVGCPNSNPETRDWKGDKYGSLVLPTSNNYIPEAVTRRDPAAALSADQLRAIWGLSLADGNASLGQGANNNTVIYNRFNRVRNLWKLPPGFGSGSGLQRIADDVAGTSYNAVDFREKHGYDLDEGRKVATAVGIVQNVVRGLQTVFVNSVVLDPNYVSSSNHRPSSFSAFVDNVLGQGRPSTFLRRPAQTFKANIQSPFGSAETADAAGLIPTAEVSKNLDNVTGVQTYVTDLQNKYLGSITTAGAVNQRYGARFGQVAVQGVRPAIPAVDTVKANLNSGAAPKYAEDLAVFDPLQRQGAVALIGANDFTSIFNALPSFAQQRFGDAASLNRPVAYDGNDDVTLFAYSESMGPQTTPVELKTAYSNLNRLILNFTKTIIPGDKGTTAEEITDTYVKRAVVLALLSLVNDQPAKKGDKDLELATTIAKRFNRIIDEIITQSGVSLGSLRDGPSDDIDKMSLVAFKQAIQRFFDDKADLASDTFGSAKSAGGKMVQKTATNLINMVELVVRKAQADKESINKVTKAIVSGRTQEDDSKRGSAAGVPRWLPDDYMRSDLRFSPEMLTAMYNYTNNNGGTQRLPLALPADPEDNDTIITPARFRSYANAVVDRGVVPAAFAPSHLSDRKLGTSSIADMPAAANVRLLKKRGMLHSTHGSTFGMAGAIENSVRRSENYGVRDQRKLVDYNEDREGGYQRRGGGGGDRDSNSRFRLAEDDNMDLSNSPSYYKPDARSVTGMSGSLACMDYRLDDEISASRNLQENWDEMDKLSQGDPALAAIGKVFLATPTKWSNWEALAENNVIFPMTVLLSRPLAVFETYSLYFLKAGKETLVTRFGQPLSTWSNESQRQIYSLTLCFKSKTTCINEKNIYHVPSAFIANILRGFGCGFYNRESFKNACNPEIPGVESLIAIAEPYEPYLSRKPPCTIALTGKFKFLEYNYQDDPETNNALHYFNVYLANKLWGFLNFSKAGKSDERTKMLYGNAMEPMYDFVVHAGQSLHWNPAKHGHKYKRASQGYFEDRYYGPGMCKTWRDCSKAYITQNFTDYDDI